MTLFGYRRVFPATMLSRENEVLPAQLETVGELASTHIGGADVTDATTLPGPTPVQVA